MSPSLDTFNPAALNRSDPSAAQIPGNKPVASSSKTSKTNGSSIPQRIDFEPLYTELKILVGHNWSGYQDALTKFIQGRISGDEFNECTDSFIYSTPQIEHAHNALICAILYNVSREPPEHTGPGLWVTSSTNRSANSGISKPNIASDSLEQRLKIEIKALPPRDRRRLRNAGLLVEGKAEDEYHFKRPYEDFYKAGQIRVPESMPAGSGAKTNWDLEIRKRYTQPLFSETLEFPDATTMLARMTPMCYEYGVTAGPSGLVCADLATVATEIHVKELMATIFNRTRANGPKYENGASGGIATSAYLRQREKEENDFRDGKIQRGRDSGLLPVENREAMNRRPIGMADIKIASGIGRGIWNGRPLIGSRVLDAPLDSEYDDYQDEKKAREAAAVFDAETGKQVRRMMAAMAGQVNQPQRPLPPPPPPAPADEMEIDDDYGWQGCGARDQNMLGSLLEDCLSVRA